MNDPMFNVRNAVLVALMQVGVIVFGVCGAGASRRAWTAMEDKLQIPDSISNVIHYGPLAMVIPLGWALFALWLRERPDVSDDAKSLAFYSGIMVVVLLALIMGVADIKPWLGIDWGVSHTPDS